MRRFLFATAISVSLVPAMMQPAKAWGGGGVVLGTLGGLAAGTVIGSALARPYAYPYPYAPYPYYYYPAPVYATPYAYPPAAYYAPPAYLPPPPPVSGPSSAVAPAAAQPHQGNCRAGQFFNTLTGTCDRR